MGKKSYAPDPKPSRRSKLEKPDYNQLVARMLARFRKCQLCGKRRSESAHHVVPRGQGGDDIEENLAMLCGSGTTGCHGEVEEKREARKRLRAKLRPEVVSYAIARKGEGWFDRRYPE